MYFTRYQVYNIGVVVVVETAGSLSYSFYSFEDRGGTHSLRQVDEVCTPVGPVEGLFTQKRNMDQRIFGSFGSFEGLPFALPVVSVALDSFKQFHIVSWLFSRSCLPLCLISVFRPVLRVASLSLSLLRFVLPRFPSFCYALLFVAVPRLASLPIILFCFITIYAFIR